MWDDSVSAIAREAKALGLKNTEAERLATFAVRTVRHDVANRLEKKNKEDAHYYGEHFAHAAVEGVIQWVRGKKHKPKDIWDLD